MAEEPPEFSEDPTKWLAYCFCQQPEHSPAQTVEESESDSEELVVEVESSMDEFPDAPHPDSVPIPQVLQPHGQSDDTSELTKHLESQASQDSHGSDDMFTLHEHEENILEQEFQAMTASGTLPAPFKQQDSATQEESTCAEQDITTIIEPTQPSLPDPSTLDLSYLMNPCPRPAPVPDIIHTDDEASHVSVLPTKEITPANPYYQFLQAIFDDDQALQCEWESYQRILDANLYASLVSNYNQVYIARADNCLQDWLVETAFGFLPSKICPAWVVTQLEATSRFLVKAGQHYFSHEAIQQAAIFYQQSQTICHMQTCKLFMKLF